LPIGENESCTTPGVPTLRWAPAVDQCRFVVAALAAPEMTTSDTRSETAKKGFVNIVCSVFW
jgi:hypothetical protein